MSKGGGSQGETRYNWNPVMEGYWGGNEGNPGGLLGEAASLASRGWQSYGQPRFAMLRGEQDGGGVDPLTGRPFMGAGNYTRLMASESSNPLGAMNGARTQIEDTLGGDYLGANPYDDPAANFYAGHDVPALNPFVAGPGSNEFIDQYTETDRNAFGGQSPYFRDQMLSGMQDIADVYKNATDPSLKAAAVLNGTFGGGDHIRQQAMNEDALGKNLTRFADSQLQGQYDRSAGLEDSFLSRDLQNQQQNRQSAGGWREAQLGRGYENFNQGTDRGFQAAENAFNRGATGWEGERGRQMQGIGYGQGEQGLAYQRIGGLQDFGNFRQSQDQRQYDFDYDQTMQQRQHPYQNIDWFSGILGRAMGGGGMNTTIYGPSGGGQNAANAVGAGLGLYGMFRN
jgi:hypothetical protein